MKGGGPAFPGSRRINMGGGDFVDCPEDGMSLRDYFAAKALPVAMDSIAANTDEAILPLCESEGLSRPFRREALIARLSFNIADAMIAERERVKEAQ